jgi:hypothetical protein
MQLGYQGVWPGQRFFARVEGSYVQAMSYAPGDVFGKGADHPSQVRGALEMGGDLLKAPQMKRRARAAAPPIADWCCG